MPWYRPKRGGEAGGRNREGLTVKVPAVVDRRGTLLHVILSRGNRNDIYPAPELLKGFDLQGKLVLADKGYDRDPFVKWVESRAGIVVVSRHITAKPPVILIKALTTHVLWLKICF